MLLVTERPSRTSPAQAPDFRRVFHGQEDYLDLHLSILKGIHDRYDTPFFTALRTYSQKPTGVFHALPIARGKSISKSHWIQDMGEFYGKNMFLAETSATRGGLDSLLQPHGPLKVAQEMAARAFGAEARYFVTNGTSTANKIVMQALVRPGDIVLVVRDCHKSHHYGLVLAGAYPSISMRTRSPSTPCTARYRCSEIKKQLLGLKASGKLDRVGWCSLTNCTFDGIVYDLERVMQECLAIKPDMVFLWDEAWFAFARFTPHLPPSHGDGTAASSGRALPQRGIPRAVRRRVNDRLRRQATNDDAAWLEARLLPDPDQVARARLRHALDAQDADRAAPGIDDPRLRPGLRATRPHDAFHEAYMTHTSTSPNYQILASLDVGRRQVELEGYELVQRQLELAMCAARAGLGTTRCSATYFRLLGRAELIPAEFRPSGVEPTTARAGLRT